MGKKESFHSPFADVARALKKKMDDEAKAKEAAARPPPRAVETKSRKTKGSKAPEAAADSAHEPTFAELMAGTATLGKDARGKTAAPERTAERAALREKDEADALATLAGMVDGSGTLEESDEDDDVIEGWAKGLDKKVLRALRRGDYGVVARLDLHGMRQETARDAVERFLADAHARGLRAVLVIHGRGINSEAGVPVLKRGLRSWLARGRMARHILAFSAAAPHDGGAGAVYVLLRR